MLQYSHLKFDEKITGLSPVQSRSLQGEAKSAASAVALIPASKWSSLATGFCHSEDIVRP